MVPEILFHDGFMGLLECLAKLENGPQRKMLSSIKSGSVILSWCKD